MELTISIVGRDGAVKASAAGSGRALLVYDKAYEEGDAICLASDAPGYVCALLEDSMAESFGYLAAPFRLIVPFGEKRVCYSPKSFSGELHLLQARVATEEEIARRRNLCLNPLDSHENQGLFPHAHANVETRGESVFAARNAVDGCYANAGHGIWPYQSWGINRRPDAELTVEFGRPVTLDALSITIRADFPHDNWWKQATVTFSDGGALTLSLARTAEPQCFSIAPRTVTWLKLGQLLKDETDPSPFPALTQLEAWGQNASC